MRFIPLAALPDLEHALADRISTGTRFEVRNALAVALGLHGLRVSEVSRCRFEDLDLHGQAITIDTIKRGIPRTLPLDPSLIEALLTWRAGSTCTWLLFTDHQKPVYPTGLRRYCRAITFETFGHSYRFHALRHTFAMRLYAATKDLLLVKRALGHRSISSTLVYAEALSDLPTSVLVRLAPGTQEQEDILSSSSSMTAKSVDNAQTIALNTAQQPNFRRTATR